MGFEIQNDEKEHDYTVVVFRFIIVDLCDGRRVCTAGLISSAAACSSEPPLFEGGVLHQTSSVFPCSSDFQCSSMQQRTSTFRRRRFTSDVFSVSVQLCFQHIFLKSFSIRAIFDRSFS